MSPKMSPLRIGLAASLIVLMTNATEGLPQTLPDTKDSTLVLTRQLQELTAIVMSLRSEIEQSRAETRQVREELQLVLARLEGGAVSGSEGSALSTGSAAEETQDAVITFQPAVTAEDRLARLEENQLLLTDRISEHYQTKVESASRYRTRLSGIVMLNVFGNRGHVDSFEVPTQALRRGPLDPGGTFGMTALQSELGFETYGPILAGGRTSAALRFDFFGVSSDGTYNPSWGGVRLRTAGMRVDWADTSLIAGQDAPFLSPLSPTSVASLGYPVFSHAGNLWSWVPQVRVEHRRTLSESDTLSFQGGIIDPVSRGSGQPAYGTRVAWSRGDSERRMTFGVSGYYSPQHYGADRNVDGWGGTADWQVPFGERLRLSGEFYRGRALGGLGAGQGRSVLYDGSPSSTLTEVAGLNVTGGWAQLSIKATEALEFNAAHGQDTSHRADLRRYFATYGDTLTARNRSEMLNIIYRPRTDLIFSLEYRRLHTGRLFSEDRAGHVNLGVGVLF